MSNDDLKLSHPAVREARLTCLAVPVQFEGTLTDGRHFYFRYRFGRAQLGVGATFDAAVEDSVPDPGVRYGTEMQGSLDQGVLDRLFAEAARARGIEPTADEYEHWRHRTGDWPTWRGHRRTDEQGTDCCARCGEDWPCPPAQAYASGLDAAKAVPAGIVSFEGDLGAEELAEFAERWRAAGGPEPFVLRRRTSEGRRAYLAAKRAELEAAGKDTEIIDLIEQTGDDHG